MNENYISYDQFVVDLKLVTDRFSSIDLPYYRTLIDYFEIFEKDCPIRRALISMGKDGLTNALIEMQEALRKSSGPHVDKLEELLLLLIDVPETPAILCSSHRVPFPKSQVA